MILGKMWSNWVSFGDTPSDIACTQSNKRGEKMKNKGRWSSYRKRGKRLRELRQRTMVQKSLILGHQKWIFPTVYDGAVRANELKDNSTFAPILDLSKPPCNGYEHKNGTFGASGASSALMTKIARFIDCQCSEICFIVLWKERSISILTDLHV